MPYSLYKKDVEQSQDQIARESDVIVTAVILGYFNTEKLNNVVVEQDTLQNQYREAALKTQKEGQRKTGPVQYNKLDITIANRASAAIRNHVKLLFGTVSRAIITGSIPNEEEVKELLHIWHLAKPRDDLAETLSQGETLSEWFQQKKSATQERVEEELQKIDRVHRESLCLYVESILNVYLRHVKIAKSLDGLSSYLEVQDKALTKAKKKGEKYAEAIERLNAHLDVEAELTKYTHLPVVGFHTGNLEALGPEMSVGEIEDRDIEAIGPSTAGTQAVYVPQNNGKAQITEYSRGSKSPIRLLFENEAEWQYASERRAWQMYRGKGAYIGAYESEGPWFPTQRIAPQEDGFRQRTAGSIKDEKKGEECSREKRGMIKGNDNVPPWGHGCFYNAPAFPNDTEGLKEAAKANIVNKATPPQIAYNHGMCIAMVVNEAARREESSEEPTRITHELLNGYLTTKAASCFACSTYMTANRQPPSATHIGRAESWYPPEQECRCVGTQGGTSFNEKKGGFSSRMVKIAGLKDQAQLKIVTDEYQKAWQRKVSEWYVAGLALMELESDEDEVLKKEMQEVINDKDKGYDAHVCYLNALAIHVPDMERIRRVLKKENQRKMKK